eukprot:1671942-Pyramimonas_sp.AAC.1
MHSRGATSSAPVKRQPPGEPVKQVPVLNPGLARHPGDDQEESFLGSTHHHQQTSSSSFRTKTNNTYFHRMLQRGNAQESNFQTKLVWSILIDAPAITRHCKYHAPPADLVLCFLRWWEAMLVNNCRENSVNMSCALGRRKRTILYT